MLKNKYYKSTSLINQFIIEHNGLIGGTTISDDFKDLTLYSYFNGLHKQLQNMMKGYVKK